MGALLPAFVAALLAEFGDKTQLLVLMLAAHFGRRRPVLAGIALAAAANGVISAAGGELIAGLITPEARALMLALALLFAGAGALLPVKPPTSVAGWRLGAFASSFGAFLILEFGDKTQFLTAAIAARYGAPILTAIGATAGVVIASALALLLGDALPRARLRTGAAALFLVIGVAVAIGALGLI